MGEGRNVRFGQHPACLGSAASLWFMGGTLSFLIVVHCNFLGIHRKITTEMTFPQLSCTGWRRVWLTYSCPSVTLKHCQQCLQSQIQRRKTITKTQTIIKTKTKCISVLYFCHQLWGAVRILRKTTPPTIAPRTR